MMRAVAIVRVSQSKGREGESFVSPVEQRQRIEAACERDGIDLLAVHEEIDVSGGTPLERRPGLTAAIEAIEAREADVLMVAYFDRLVRSLRVQQEVIERVESVGGRVLALDVGAVSADTATQWLQGTMIGAVSEYVRRTARERAGAAQADAIARGVPTFDNIPPGYERGPDKRLRPNADAPAIREAFAMRAGGATIKDIRAFLKSRGIERSYHGVQSMLSSRIYLGELHFGKLSNPEAHEPIIDRDLFAAVQRVKVTRGRRAKSDRLLARLGILRCGTCGSRMVVGTQTQKGRMYPFYRCPPVGDCERRMTIGAEIAERVVVEVVKERIKDASGRASDDARAQEAEADLERAQAALDSAIRAFEGLEDEPAAVERLRELRAVRDAARERAEQLSGLRAALTITVDDWDYLTLDEKRAIIRANIDRAVVRPGKGAGRITVIPRS